jgi:hypothetical protein
MVVITEMGCVISKWFNDGEVNQKHKILKEEKIITP